MTRYWADYQSDFERVFYGAPLSTAFELEDAGEQTVSEADLLPQTFVAVTGRRSPCKLPITPRRLVAYVSDVERFILPIPFRGGTAEYQALLAEVEANSLVRAIDIRPEQISPYQLLITLGRFG